MFPEITYKPVLEEDGLEHTRASVSIEVDVTDLTKNILIEEKKKELGLEYAGDDLLEVLYAARDTLTRLRLSSAMFNTVTNERV